MAPTNVKTVHQTSLLHIESNPDRLELLSPTHGQCSQQKKRTNHAPISLDQQVQVFQSRTSCISKENCNTQVHGCGGLDLVKPARESASSRPKPCASLNNALPILPVRRSLLALVGRKHFSLRNLLVRAFDSRAQRFSPPLARRRSNCPPPSPNLVLTHPVECATTRLRVLLRHTRLSATVPPASGGPPPPEGHQIGARKRRTW